VSCYKKETAIAGRVKPETKKAFDKAMKIHAGISGGRIFNQEAVEFAALLYVQYWEKKVKKWKPGKL